MRTTAILTALEPTSTPAVISVEALSTGEAEVAALTL
jgi:hypothetical protein